MASGMKTVIYPVKDLGAAKQLYGSIFGTEPYMDEPYYVGFSVNGYDVGLDPNGHAKGMTGPVSFWYVDDINRSLEALMAAGAELQQAVTDIGGGSLIATVRDVDGNEVGVIQAA